MIIKYPTGFYFVSLTSDAIKNISLTYFISNNEPPRTDLIYSKVPTGILATPRIPKDPDIILRREAFGELVYSLSKSNRSIEGNDSRQFELGQVLEFGLKSGRDISPMLVDNITEVQHNTNRLDYKAMGITEQEQNDINSLALTTHNILVGRLNELKRLRSDAELTVNSSQKLINELSRTIDSLSVVLLESPGYGSLGTELSNVEDLISKLKLKMDNEFKKRDKAIEMANFYASESYKVVDQLKSVDVVVK
jgi:hypothetical protein